MLLKIPPNEITLGETLKITFLHKHSTKISHRGQSPNFTNSPQFPNSAVFFLCKDNFYSFISPKYRCISKIFTHNTVFTMGNKRNRRSRRIESQSSDRDENTPDTSLTQGNATLINVSENVNNILHRNPGSEITEPSQIRNEIEVIFQRLAERNNTKMTLIEE